MTDGSSRQIESIEQLEQQVAKILTEVTGCNVEHPKAEIAALGIDSLLLLDVLAVLEQHYDITLMEDVVEEFRTVHQIAHIVRDAIRISSQK